jgi:hypothetical protein
MHTTTIARSPKLQNIFISKSSKEGARTDSEIQLARKNNSQEDEESNPLGAL